VKVKEEACPAAPILCYQGGVRAQTEQIHQKVVRAWWPVFFGGEAAHNQIVSRIQELIDRQSAQAIQAMNPECQQ